jgi:hypothetical protein
MKRITLTDEAYQRLKEWQEGPQDSLSDVVLRVVPASGTLAGMLASFRQLPPLTDDQATIMDDAVAWANDPKHFVDYSLSPE